MTAVEGGKLLSIERGAGQSDPDWHGDLRQSRCGDLTKQRLGDTSGCWRLRRRIARRVSCAYERALSVGGHCGGGGVRAAVVAEVWRRGKRHAITRRSPGGKTFPTCRWSGRAVIQ